MASSKIRIVAISMIAASLCLFAGACCKAGPEPGPPYANPDDVNRFTAGDFASITYTYYCLNGRYVSIDYNRADECSDYEESSRFTSSGICDSGSLFSRFRGLDRNAQIDALRDLGREVSVSTHSSRGLVSP